MDNTSYSSGIWKKFITSDFAIRFAGFKNKASPKILLENMYRYKYLHNIIITRANFISSRGTRKSQFRSYRRRKAKNTPKTKKSQQTALSRKKASLRPPRRRMPVSLFSDEKKPICAVPWWKITTNGILRVRTLIKNISEITRGTNYIWICAGRSTVPTKNDQKFQIYLK